MTSIQAYLGSLRTKLMVLVLVPAIPAFALALQRNFQQRQTEKAGIVQDISTISRLIAAHELGYVRNTRQLLATLSGFEFLVGTTNDTFSRLNFENLLKLSPDYCNFGLIETNGAVFASAGTFASGTTNLADRSYFKRTLATQKFSIGDLQPNGSTNERCLSFGYPVTNSLGKLSRVLFGSVKLEKLIETARNITLPEGAVATVMDSAGNVLLRLPEDGGWPGRAALDTEFARTVLKLKNGVIETRGLDGIERVYACTPISDDISEQLFIAVGVPWEVFFVRSNDILGRSLLVMLAAIVATLLIASLFAERALVRPITALSGTADQLAKGNLNARSNTSLSTRELRALAEAFNSMAACLQQRDADLRKAHDNIAQINADLERRVAERTAELTAVNQEMEAFSYSVSHDLRAPLRHMDGFAELLQRSQSDRLDDKGRRHLQIISDAARKMGNLIDDLLVFARMGRQELHKSRVNMNALVSDAIAQHETDCAGRKIEWEISTLPEIDGDSALLKQVWMNLISNAIKYTRPRDVARISISCEETPSEFVFSLRDNGVGFDMKYADKLFGVFQRLHRESEFEGTGVGLANVRRIIVRHRGRTWAESAIDEGSVFYFSIPK
jgi:signal transduction histidine kinase